MKLLAMGIEKTKDHLNSIWRGDEAYFKVWAWNWEILVMMILASVGYFIELEKFNGY